MKNQKEKKSKFTETEKEQLNNKFGYGEEQGYPEITRFEDLPEEEKKRRLKMIKKYRKEK